MRPRTDQRIDRNATHRPRSSCPFAPARIVNATGRASSRQNQSVLLFADVSGFTALTEKLARSGGRGIETLTVRLNAYFSGLLDAVFAVDGDVLKFGGDALLVALDGPDGRARALRCSWQMHDWTAAFNRRSGRGFRLGLHVGVAAGRLHEELTGSPTSIRREHFVDGSAVRGALLAADRASDGTTVISGPIADWKAALNVPDAVASVRPVTRGFHLIPAQRRSRPRIVPPTDRPTIVHSLWDRSRWPWPYLDPALRDILHPVGGDPFGSPSGLGGCGEHRRITTVFVFWNGADAWGDLPSPRARAHWQKLFRLIASCTDSHGALWARSDPGDRYQKLLLLFGAPRAAEDDPIRAVACARDLMAELRALSSDCPKLSARVGITTGGVFTGFVGDARRFEYTAMGGPVNMAARLAAKAPRFAIWTDPATAAATASQFRFAARRPRRFKGVARPVAPRCLAGASTATVAASATDIDFYDVELGQARSQLTSSGTVPRLHITGASGGGRSHFLHRLAGAVPDRRTVRVDCPFEGRRQPLSVLRSVIALLATHSTFSRTSAAGCVLSGEGTITRAISRWGRELFQQKLREQLGETFRPNDGAAWRLAIDDWHWADESSKATLQPILDDPDVYGFPVIWTERADDATGSDRGSCIHLDSLSKDRFDNLLGRLLPDAPIARDLRRVLHLKSGGRPVFAAQLIDHLRRMGLLHAPSRTGRAWRCNDLTSVALPDSLRATQVHLLDRLDRGTRSVARAAAVWGGGDWRAADIAAVLGGELPPNGVRRGIDDLMQRDLICPVAPTVATGPDARRWGTAFRFARPALRQVAYETMSFAARRLWHRRAAARCARRGGHWRDRTAEHWFYAEEPEAAFAALTQAAARAERIGALDNAREYTRRALMARHGRFDPEREKPVPGGRLDSADAPLLHTLGTLCHSLGRYDDARASFGRCVRAAQRAGDSRLAHRARLELARVEWTRGDYDRARRALTSLLRASPDDRTRGRALTLQGELLRRKGRFEDADRRLERAEPLVCADPAAALEAANSRGLVAWNRGRLDQAAAHYRRALAMPRSCLGTAQRGQIANNLGIIHQERAQLATAGRYFQKALALFDRLGHRRNRAYCLGNLANIWRAQARFERARAAYEETAAVCAEIGESHAGAYTTGNLGDLFADFGDSATARRLFDRTIAFAKRVEDLELIAECEGRIAALLLRARRWKALDCRVAAALKCARQCGSLEFELLACCLRADALRDRQQTTDARAAYAEILHRAETGGLWLYVLWAWHGLAAAADDPSESRDFTRQGLKLARRSGYRWWHLRFALLDARHARPDARGTRRNRPATIAGDIAATIGDHAVRRHFESLPAVTTAHTLAGRERELCPSRSENLTN